MDDPKHKNKSKDTLASQLGEQMAKFPLPYAQPVLIHPSSPFSNSSSKKSYATVSLLNLGGRHIAVTCFHVLKKYQTLLDRNSQTIFQIGHLLINPLEKIISQNEELHLVTLDLHDENPDELANIGEIRADFFTPAHWPPGDVQQGDWIAFAGYPGHWRSHPSPFEVKFSPFSSGACYVDTVSKKYIQCTLEREHWVRTFGSGNLNLKVLDGMSGGPVFAVRDLNFEFVGILDTFSSTYDFLAVSRATFIREDGIIEDPSKL